MKQMFIKGRLILLFLLTLKGLQLYGQNELRFSYECNDEIKGPIKTKILLTDPNNKISDLLKYYGFSEKNYFKTAGKYTLSIRFETRDYGKDSIDYNFDLNGNEIITNISVSFDYRPRLIKKGSIYIEGEKVLNGYIRLNKYYHAPKSVYISYDNKYLGNESFRGPFFKIKNNSNDTLYGEYLPGYFWGTLSYTKDDSVVSTKIGILDYDFVYSPPLYPDSTKYATVGSFGYTNKLIPFEYRFEVMLATKWQSQGIGIYKERQNFDWWAGTKDYYILKYDFKVCE